jgi:intracellular septation protein
MKLLFDFFPLILFFVAFKWFDIFVATGVAIVATLVQVGWYRWKHQRTEPAHLITLVIIVIMGGLTIYLHDDTFIKWKPTLIYWAFTLAIIVSLFTRGRNALEFLMGAHISMPENAWRKLNISWAVFFFVTGLLNLYVAFYYAPNEDPATRQELWVNFKVFGMTIMMLVFSVGSMMAVSKHIEMKEEKE